MGILSVISIYSFGQDTIFLDKEYNPCEKAMAEFFKIEHKGNKILNRIVDETFLMSGVKESESCYYFDPTGKTDNKISDGIQKTWHKNGTLKSIYATSNGKYNDTLTTYWQNGKLKRKDLFKKGKFINGSCYDSTGVKIKHFDYEIIPQYPGGDNKLLSTLASNLEMPQKVRDTGLRVSVIVKFVIDEEGNVTDISMYKSFNTEVDNEAMRVVKLLKKFTPASLDGDPFKCKYLLPINFEGKN